MADVFISYKRADREKAAALAKALKRERLSVWWDTHLSTGDDWLRKLVREIDEAKCLIGVWTSNCVDADGFFQHSESGHNFIRIEHERAGTKKVIGALLDRNAMPILYADRQCAQLSDWDMVDPHFPEFRKLVEAITDRVRAATQGAGAVINLFEIAETTIASSEKQASAMLSRRGEEWTVGEACMFLLVSASLQTDMDMWQEVSSVHLIVSRSRSLRMLGSEALSRMDSALWDRVKQRGNALPDACQALPAEMRLPLFGQCVEIVLEDGDLNRTKVEYLNELALLLKLNQQDAQRMFQMLSLKRQF